MNSESNFPERTTKRSKTIAMSEYIAQFEQQYGSREEREKRRRELNELLSKDEQPLLQVLRSIGMEVNSVWDLVNTKVPYPKAIPVLIEHLGQPYHPKTKEGIARALTVKGAMPTGWEDMVREFKKTEPDERISEPTKRGLKFALANALAYISDRTVLDDILELVQDKRHGEDRFVLVRTLWRYSDKRVIDVLQKLTEDKEAPVARDAAKSLARIQKRLEKHKKS